jgi:predicted molibdopterin-dependent oxidoreductase YjgC
MRVAVDGVELEVNEGTSVLEAVEAAGGRLPTLCYDDRLAPFGACRTCLVGLEGAPAPVPACTTRCREGMRIDTHDATATRVVRTVVELVLSELERPPGPTTELARVAGSLGLANGRFEGAAHELDRDERHPYLAFQHELCISCGRCVRACDEVQGAFALTVTGRGFHSNVTAGLDSGFQDSSCVSCGACADTCPTGAIIERRLLTLERERDDGRAA